MIFGLLEIEIMNTIWKLQSENEDRDISISDVVSELQSSSIERAYTTIKTVMDRLVSKDVLVRYKNGKKFFYRSVIDREEASLSAYNASLYSESYCPVAISKNCFRYCSSVYPL